MLALSIRHCRRCGAAIGHITSDVCLKCDVQLSESRSGTPAALDAEERGTPEPPRPNRRTRRMLAAQARHKRKRR